MGKSLFAIGLLLLACGSDPFTGGSKDAGDLGSQLDLTFGYDAYPKLDAACERISAEAKMVVKPVDIIFVIDNSGSMSNEIKGVEQNINTNFVNIIQKSGIDYRVIMLAAHGASSSYRICVDKPLSGNPTCSPPAADPVNNPPYFYHYNYPIYSTDSLSKIISTYNAPDPSGQAPGGWSDWLRADAVKVFIEITDDNSSMSYASFETQLLNLKPNHFGSSSMRNYIFHTIAGMSNNSPSTKPWQPEDAIVGGVCSGAVNSGSQYQYLSQLSGGLRFPICNLNSFDSVFQEVAQGVIRGAQVNCEFEIPQAPDGKVYDLTAIEVLYTPSAAAEPELFELASGIASCHDTGFYLTETSVVLCPQSCKRVQGDVEAKVEVGISCVTQIK